jgi:hypothetical protein
VLPEGARYYCYYYCCWRELCVSYNQPRRDKRSRDTREQVSKLLSFSHSVFLFKLSGKKKKKTLQRNVGHSCSAVKHRSNTPRRSVLLDIAATRCDVQRATGHCSNATRSSALLAIAAALLAIAAALQRPAHCCNNATRTLQAAVRCRPAPQQCCKLQHSWPTPQQRCELQHSWPAPQQRYKLQRSRPSLQRCEELQCSAAVRHRCSGS